MIQIIKSLTKDTLCKVPNRPAKCAVLGDFPGSQCLRLCLPIQGVWVRSLIRELGYHMPQGQKTKTWNRSSIVTNSMKTLKKNCVLRTQAKWAINIFLIFLYFNKDSLDFPCQKKKIFRNFLTVLWFGITFNVNYVWAEIRTPLSLPALGFFICICGHSFLCVRLYLLSEWVHKLVLQTLASKNNFCKILGG